MVQTENRFLSGRGSLANFFIIDHSLRQLGGHHFDYVSCIAEAANELGYLTTIGSNREFAKSTNASEDSIEQLGIVRRVFRDTTYQADSYLAGLQHLTRSNSSEALLSNFESNWFKRLLNSQKHHKHRRRREQFVRRFAADCERFFRSSLQTNDDHAFLTTVSELELMGLAAYLSSNPKTFGTTWHLQFHFNLFEGRTPEYGSQSYISEAIRSCFIAALARLSCHSVNFYTTSETLADQYQRLGVGEFEVLPYPVSKDFSRLQTNHQFQRDGFSMAAAGIKDVSLQTPPANQGHQLVDTGSSTCFGADHFPPHSQQDVPSLDAPDPSDAVACGEFHRTLRITCPGELRREKNQVEYLQPLVNRIWESHLSTGNVRIVVQRPAKKWHAKRPKLEIELPQSADELSCSPIEYSPHPLSKQGYVELIKSSDCGLLFYDSRVYFSRRAGVLGELLSAGKPVIVSAGSWLAEQIQEPIFQYVDGLVDSSRLLRTIESSDFRWNSKNVPMAGGVLSFDQSRHPFEFEVARKSDSSGLGEDAFVIEFDWHWPTDAGVFCRVEVKQKDDLGQVINTSSQVVGFRRSSRSASRSASRSGSRSGSRAGARPARSRPAGSRPVNALFPMLRQARTVEFSLTNQFHESTASIKRVRIRTLQCRDELESKQGLPMGQVGIVASDAEDLPNCIDELVQHFDHYSRTAIEFSDRWYARHEPQRTVDHLVSTARGNRRVA